MTVPAESPGISLIFMLTRPNKYCLLEANPHPEMQQFSDHIYSTASKHKVCHIYMSIIKYPIKLFFNTIYVTPREVLPEFRSRMSWMALPLSICLIWESDHVILKSSRKVAGLPVTERAITSTKSERQAKAFLKEEYMAMMIVLKKKTEIKERLVMNVIWKRTLGGCIYSSDSK